MSQINIHRVHHLSHDQAKQAAEEVAAGLNERFQLAYHWEGNSLHFERSGVSGSMDVEDASVHIKARLGFLLLPMKPLFEKEINRYMDKLFSEG